LIRKFCVHSSRDISPRFFISLLHSHLGRPDWNSPDLNPGIPDPPSISELKAIHRRLLGPLLDAVHSTQHVSEKVSTFKSKSRPVEPAAQFLRNNSSISNENWFPVDELLSGLRNREDDETLHVDTVDTHLDEQLMATHSSRHIESGDELKPSRSVSWADMAQYAISGNSTLQSISSIDIQQSDFEDPSLDLLHRPYSVSSAVSSDSTSSESSSSSALSAASISVSLLLSYLCAICFQSTSLFFFIIE
jgi:hypothetical protein